MSNVPNDIPRYIVARGGQNYGPYTLEDLRRFVGTGNILPTDMARAGSLPDGTPLPPDDRSADAAAEWVPVARLLAGGSVPAPPPVPAVPPPFLPSPGSAQPPSPRAALPAFNANVFPDAPDLNWGLVLALAIFTNGLFLVVWDLVVCNWLRKVHAGSRALTHYIIAYGFIGLMLVFAIAGSIFFSLNTLGGSAANTVLPVLFGLLLLACLTGAGVMSIVARFTERRELLEHFNGPEPVGLRLSGVMTFFFSGLYFQYHLNRIKRIKDVMRYGRPLD